VLLKALAKQPDDRYETATAFVAALVASLPAEEAAVMSGFARVDKPSKKKSEDRTLVPATSIDQKPGKKRTRNAWVWPVLAVMALVTLCSPSIICRINDAYTTANRAMRPTPTPWPTATRQNTPTPWPTRPTPGDENAAYRQGQEHHKQGEYKEAIAYYDEAIALRPDNARIYYQRGMCYYNLEDYEQAIADLNRAIEMGYTGYDAYDNPYNYLGWNYLYLNDYEQSIDSFTKAIEDHPNAQHFTYRGWANYFQGDYDQALQDLDQAIALNPNSYSLIRRADVYAALGDPQQATADLERALSIAGSIGLADIHNDTAWTLVSKLDSHYELAVDHALQSVELDPQAYNHDTLGLVYYKLEQYEKALEHYGIAISFNNQMDASYKGRGDVYLAMGDTEAALADYETYLSKASPGPERDEVEAIVESLK
jgi:tetratricopeptide (TPR) repeat protein